MNEAQFLAAVDAVFGELELLGKTAKQLGTFDGAELRTLATLEAASNQAHADLATMMGEDVQPRDVDGSCSVSTVGGVGRLPSDFNLGDPVDFDTYGRVDAGRHSWTKVRVASGLKALQLCRASSKKSHVMARVDVAIPRQDRTAIQSNSLYAGIRNGDWIYLGDGAQYDPVKEYKTLQAIRGALRSAFVMRYHWRVLLGYDGFPRISFPTDPLGVLAAFRLRDLPPGRTRRSALLHWVEGHYRKNRCDPDALIEVRRYLRGTRHFNWNGISGAVFPAEIDEPRQA